ncbi:MAG: hypothetical protein EZS28_024774 [Streblomastix strix]|uniref:Uncharacterized protein n=1 Tax=Streblomastix strix TaxID=222440 RepID=A0A5J4VB05_9EUKA|nr:MAG: hypothetical protein EZS28_024774 [Streblomastix strix]
MLDQKAGWPAELGAGGVNKLDYQVYCSPKVGGLKVGSTRTDLVTENLKIVVLLGICQILGMVTISKVMVSIILYKIVI